MKLTHVYVVAVAALTGLASSVWGCSSSGKGSPGSGAPIVGTGQTTSKSISASQGGTVTLAGSTLTIPPGALPSDTTISITSTTSSPPAGVTNLSPIYQFGPNGLVFLAPVTVALQFTSGGKNPVLIWSDPNPSGYGVLPGNVSGATLTGSVTHFSTGFVADGTTIGGLLGGGDAGATTVWDGSCAFCQGQACTGECVAPYVACGTTCADTQADPANCGGCGKSCGAGMTCANGSCAPSCSSGSSVGPTCAGEPLVHGGVNCSMCAPGFAACGSSCVQTQSSPTNCGACGVSCGGGTCQNGVCTSLCPASGQVCANGACVSACPSGEQICATEDAGTSSCANLATDSQNCGACGIVCGTGKTCSGGSCVQECATQGGYGTCSGGPLADGGPDCSHCGGYAPCGSMCVMLSADPQNCGACGVVCPTGQVCSNGACTAGCPGGDVCYDTACVSACPAGWAVCAQAGGSTGAPPNVPANSCTILSSAENCGACGHACPAGEGCLNGECVGQCVGSSSGGGSTSGGGGASPDAGN